VLLSTHIVDDIAQTCARVVVVDQGTVVFQGSTIALAERAMDSVWRISLPPGTPPPDHPIVAIAPTSDAIHYRVIAPRRPEPEAAPLEPTVEDGYVALMHTARPRATHRAR
jgi:ABC-2 type transport system ATP-binding protein